MKVKAFYPVKLVIDGEEICLRIKRMDLEEFSDFSSRFKKVGEPTHLRFISRASSGPEQVQNDQGEYMVPLEKIAENRLADMTPEERAGYEAAVKADEAAAKEFLVYVHEEFVTVERGLIEEMADGTEQSVTAGIDLLRIFGARQDVLQQILEAVRQENTLNAEQKKTWRSPVASSRSSTGRRRGRAGRKQGTTAELAVTGGSAGNGDAAAQITLSGSTETLPSNPVPSLD